MQRELGFGLLESVLAMALITVMMTVFVTALLPSVKASGESHYTTESISLGEGILQRLLSSPFDHNSDPSGFSRCDQTWGKDIAACSTKLGADSREVFALNDVDDFLGCWAMDAALCTGNLPHQPLDKLLGDTAESWRHHKVLIDVHYDQNFDGIADDPQKTDLKAHKRIHLTVDSGRGEPLWWVAYRSNY